MKDFRGIAAIFDLDHSTLDGNAGLLFTRQLYLQGVLSTSMQRQIPGLVYRYVSGKASEADVVAFASRCLDGLTPEGVKKIALECFTQSVRPRLTREGLAAMRGHLLRGHLVILASGSPYPIVDQTARFLGANVAIASRSKLVEGRFIAEVELPLSFEDGKRDLVLEALTRYGLDPSRACLYSDSPADRPLFEAIGKPILINPPKEFAQEGRARGWEVRQWKTRLGKPTAPDAFEALVMSAEAAHNAHRVGG